MCCVAQEMYLFVFLFFIFMYLYSGLSPSTIKKTYVRSITSWYPCPRFWLKSGVGPWAPCCGCPLFLRDGLNAETKIHYEVYLPIKYFYLQYSLCVINYNFERIITEFCPDKIYLDLTFDLSTYKVILFLGLLSLVPIKNKIKI